MSAIREPTPAGDTQPTPARDTQPTPAGDAPAPAESVEGADARLERRLRTRGHRVTSQRILVYRALCAQRRHLTAEDVLAAVQNVMPKISLPTIYATLQLLQDIGLVRRLSAGTGALLFESRISRHSHAVCHSCGTVLDIEEPPLASAALASAAAVGFAADDTHVLVTGLCQDCARRSIASDITATSGSSSSIPQRMHSAS
ncbi:MAG: Fur family transcriptional regulator [Solirubrobacteraceae bacterium]